jgi:hypothetical protein
MEGCQRMMNYDCARTQSWPIQWYFPGGAEGNIKSLNENVRSVSLEHEEAVISVGSQCSWGFCVKWY